MGEGRRIFECPLFQLTQLSPSPQGDPLVLWKLWGRGQVWEGTRSLLPGLGQWGEPQGGLVKSSVLSASWPSLCGPPSGLFSLDVTLTLSFPPAGQLAWSSEPGRVPWPHTGPSGCW